MTNKTLIQISDELSAGQYSSREITQDIIADIRARDAQFNSFITVSEELALEQADADLRGLDERRLSAEGRVGETREAMEQAREVLDSGRTVFAAGLDTEPLKELFLLTAKPFLYVFNVDVDELGNADLLTELRAREFYEKPTSVRKRKAAAAVKRHLKKLSRENRRQQRLY